MVTTNPSPLLRLICPSSTHLFSILSPHHTPYPTPCTGLTSSCGPSNIHCCMGEGSGLPSSSLQCHKAIYSCFAAACTSRTHTLPALLLDGVRPLVYVLFPSSYDIDLPFGKGWRLPQNNCENHSLLKKQNFNIPSPCRETTVPRGSLGS